MDRMAAAVMELLFGRERDPVMKLNIMNLEEFLQTADSCRGAVYLLHPDGRKEDINKRYGRREELWQRYRDHKNCLPLVLEIPDPKDYMRIVMFSTGDS